MPVFNRTFRIDGASDIALPDYSTGIDWNNGFASWVSFFDNNAGNSHNLTLNLTGSDWYMQTLRFIGESTMNVRLQDRNDAPDRRIQFVELHENAIVDLTTTRVDYLVGYGDDYDISYGAAPSKMVRLGGMATRA
ncbi:hypothetical protein [Oceaniglobus indicus]|uniref:hypothetical protein n=1 Tax=Oceaniglobus indicus TaxID=2047749 RepID=UPI000C195E21|nr:hypothetical protein [Oceaniglobus indicus]